MCVCIWMCRRLWKRRVRLQSFRNPLYLLIPVLFRSFSLFLLFVCLFCQSFHFDWLKLNVEEPIIPIEFIRVFFSFVSLLCLSIHRLCSGQSYRTAANVNPTIRTRKRLRIERERERENDNKTRRTGAYTLGLSFFLPELSVFSSMTRSMSLIHSIKD